MITDQVRENMKRVQVSLTKDRTQSIDDLATSTGLRRGQVRHALEHLIAEGIIHRGPPRSCRTFVVDVPAQEVRS